MILRRLRVEQFRAHNAPVEVRFDDRLTVISGPNEAGKTTLFTALQYAFFRRSSARGKDVDSLAPWNTEGLSSTVIVEFAHDNHEYKLEKTWGKRSATRLARQNTSGIFAPYMEDNADDFLAAMFCGQPQRQGVFTGFTGQAMGLAYLLFVPQAAIPIAGEPKEIALNSDARARLTEIVGAAAQSPQEARIAKAILTAYDLAFNQRGERRKGKNIISVSDQIRDVDVKIDTARAAVNAFERLGTAVVDAQQKLAAAEAAALEARDAEALALPRYENAVRFAAAARDAKAIFDERERQYQALLEKSQRYELAIKAIRDAVPARAALAKKLGDLETQFAAAQAARDAAMEQLDAANVPDPEIAMLELAIEQARECELWKKAARELQQTLSRVAEIDARAIAVAEREAEIGNVSAADIEHLQALVAAERDLRARFEASMTSITIHAEASVDLAWSCGPDSGDVKLEAGQLFERKSSVGVAFHVPGLGTIDVRGPNADSGTLEAALSEKQERLRAIEERLGTRDALLLQRGVSERETLVKERRQLECERVTLLGTQSPEALARLLAEYETRISNASVASESIVSLEEMLSTRKAALIEHRDEARARARSASEREKAASQLLSAARDASSISEANIRTSEIELATLSNDFSSDEDRQAMVRAAYAARFESEQLSEAAARAYAPYLGESDPLAAYTACQQILRARETDELEAKHALRDIERQLSESYSAEPTSVLRDLEEKREGLVALFNDERLNDNALKLLRSFVVEAETRRVERFAKPVLDRVAPWFSSVTGIQLKGLELNGDNDLAAVELASVSRPVQFEELSQGTGDQLALLIRLAFASLLTSPQCLGPMPILLDDPLVHADNVRRGRFQQILAEVSGGAQVIVFTCRPEDYVNVNALKVTLGSDSPKPERVA